MKRVLFMIFVGLSPLSMAGNNLYLCTIIQTMELSEKGVMAGHTGSHDHPLGRTFSINRDTGEMVGLPFSTQGYPHVTVLDRGNKESGYKAIVTSDLTNVWVMYLYVAEYQEGSEKPFWGTEGGDRILTGLCE